MIMFTLTVWEFKKLKQLQKKHLIEVADSAEQEGKLREDFGCEF